MRYWDAMEFALRWAELNRRPMMDRVEEAFRKHARSTGSSALWTFTTTTRRPRSMPASAASSTARAPSGPARATSVLIPGSMGTASYIGEGLGNPALRDLPARRRPRPRAQPGEAAEDLRGGIRGDGRLGHRVRRNEPTTAAEEAAFAYKDIESVMAHSADLVRPVTRLRPLGVVKG